MYIFGQYLDETAVSVCMNLVCWTLAQTLYVAVAQDIIRLGAFKSIAMLILGIASIQYHINLYNLNNDLGLFLIVVTPCILLMGLTALVQEIKQRKGAVVINLRPGDYTVLFERQLADVQYPLTAEEQQEGHQCLTQIHAGVNVILTGLGEVNPRKDRLKLLCRHRTIGYDNLDYWDCVRVIRAGSLIPVMRLIRTIVFCLLMTVSQFIIAVIYLGSTGEIYVQSYMITELYKTMFLIAGYILDYLFWYITKNLSPVASRILSILKWVFVCAILYQILQIV